jgi:hypothetical protein
LNWPGVKFGLCCGSVVGTADASALPDSEKVSPAKPSAGTAAFVIRFVFEACFARCMAASSGVQEHLHWKDILRRANNAGKNHAYTKSVEARSECIHLDERYRGNFIDCTGDPHMWHDLQRVRLDAVRNHPPT